MSHRQHTPPDPTPEPRTPPPKPSDAVSAGVPHDTLTEIEARAKNAEKIAHQAVTEGVNLKYVERLRQIAYTVARVDVPFLLAELARVSSEHGADLVKCAEQINAGWQERYERDWKPLLREHETMRHALREIAGLLFAAQQDANAGKTASAEFIDKCVNDALALARAAGSRVEDNKRG